MNNPYQQHFKKMKVQDSKSKINSKEKQKTSGRRNLTPPLSLIISTTLLLGGGVWLSFNIEKIDALLGRIEISIFGSASAKEEEKKMPSDIKKTANSTQTTQEPGPSSQNGERNLTPEELALFNKLEERRHQLDDREADLKKLEEELHQQKLMLEDKMKQLEELRSQISVQLDDRVQADQARVVKLVEMYSNMKPQKAAKVLETVNEDLVVEVMKSMKKDKAAEILNMMSAEKAQKLSEKFAGYRKD